MTSLDDLYENAAKNGIPVLGIPLENTCSMIVDAEENRASIVMSTHQIHSSVEAREALAHELGHYHTGTYYNSTYCARNIGKMEFQANVWMVKELIPPEQIQSAVKDGCCELWEIAEYCDCTESLVKTAIQIYRQKGLL